MTRRIAIRQGCVPRQHNARPVRDVIRAVATASGIAETIITGNGRRSEELAARWAVIRIARRDGRSFPEIGRIINRDHSTVLWALDRATLSIEAGTRKGWLAQKFEAGALEILAAADACLPPAAAAPVAVAPAPAPAPVKPPPPTPTKAATPAPEPRRQSTAGYVDRFGAIILHPHDGSRA